MQTSCEAIRLSLEGGSNRTKRRLLMFIVGAAVAGVCAFVVSMHDKPSLFGASFLNKGNAVDINQI